MRRNMYLDALGHKNLKKEKIRMCKNEIQCTFTPSFLYLANFFFSLYGYFDRKKEEDLILYYKKEIFTLLQIFE